jgi:hypothetical protein
MKMDAKSSVQQVLKYALLALSVELKQANTHLVEVIANPSLGSTMSISES